jgi:hypothetical protein
VKRIVQLSGGLCSFFAAKRTIERYGKQDVILLFADVLIESPGLYRFLDAAEDYLGIEITKTSDGRTPWQVFKDVGFLGNSQIDPCSRILKRERCRQWIRENIFMECVTVVVGVSWDEGREEAISERWRPYYVSFPMCDPPYLTKCDMIKEALALGLPLSEAYTDGFPHDNCGGGCVKAGQAHFAMLYKIRPAVYAEWEANEEDVRQHIGADVSILKDRRGGTTKPMTLAAFRKRIEVGDFDKQEWGGCGCGV